MAELRRAPTLAALLWILAIACAETGDDPDASGDAASASDADGSPLGPDSTPGSEGDWTAFEVVPIEFDEDLDAPVVSADGLEIYFTSTGGEGGYDIYRATRASADEGFGAPAPVDIPGDDGEKRYPEISRDGLALYYTSGDAGEIQEVTRPDTDSAWGEPTPVGAQGNFPSVADDKLALYFVELGEGGDDHALMRISRFQDGQPWSPPEEVPTSAPVFIYSSADVAGDELSIILAPVPGEDDEILRASRTSTEQPFDAFEPILPLDISGTAFFSARFSADDTEIWTAGYDGADDPAVSYYDP